MKTIDLLPTILLLLLILSLVPGILFQQPLIARSQDEPLYIAFVWHFHQPWYKNPWNESQSLLPWARLHAMKSYYHMVKLIADYGGRVKVTFNIVGSLIKQLVDYASGNTTDPYWDISRTNASQLTIDQKVFILQRFFDANWDRQISQWPRYKYLLDTRNNLLDQNNNNYTAIVDDFTVDDYRDLQVLFNLVWFNKEILYNDPDLRPLWEKAVNSNYSSTPLYNYTEWQIVLDKIKYYINATIDIWKTVDTNNWSEFITTPGFHPIAPLLINTSNALRRTPRAIIPYPYFSHPEDLEAHINISINQYSYLLGHKPTGMWPAEEAVCDELLPIIAAKGFNHLITDQSILKAYLGGRNPSAQELYAAWYRYVRNGTSLAKVYVFFRDIGFSNLISFDYDDWLDQYGYNSANPANNISDWEYYKGAAQDLVDKLYNIYKTYGGGHLVVIALDGENPWEWYLDDGWVFLNWTYHLIDINASLEAVSLQDYVNLVQQGSGYSYELGYLPTGSWIDDDSDGIGDLMRWIGEWEENAAWSLLRKAREDLGALDPNKTLTKAWWYMYAAEGSDWFWWYGRDQEVPGEENFDNLFREYIEFIYSELGLSSPTDPWPADQPIHYRSQTQVQWVGRENEAIYVFNGTDINFTVEVYGNTSTNTTADPGQLPGIRLIIHWSPVDEWGGRWKEPHYALMDYLGDSGNNDVYNYTFKDLPSGKYEVVIIANAGYNQDHAWSDAYSTTWSIIGNYRIEILPTTSASITNASILGAKILWDYGLTNGYYDVASANILNTSTRDIVDVIVKVYAPGEDPNSIYAILHWGKVSTWGGTWWPINDYVGEYLYSDSQGYHYYKIPVNIPKTGAYEAVVHVVASNDYWANWNGANMKINVTSPVLVVFNATTPSTTPTGSAVFVAPNIANWSSAGLLLTANSEFTDVDLFSKTYDIQVNTVPNPIPEPGFTVLIVAVLTLALIVLLNRRRILYALILLLLIASIASMIPSISQYEIKIDGYLYDWVDDWIVGTSTPNVTGGNGANIAKAWVTWNETHLLIALKTDNNESWNVAYGIAIDYDSTDYSGYNGTSDAWGRAIGFSNATIFPDIMVYAWWQSGNNTITAADIALWNGSTWIYRDFSNFNDNNPILPGSEIAWTGGENGLQTLELSLNWTAITGQNFTSMIGKTLHIIFFVAGDSGSSAIVKLPYEDSIRNTLTSWRRGIHLPVGLHVEYKYTRGSWSTVEGTTSGTTCVDIANRIVDVYDPGNGMLILNDTVDCWEG